MQWTKEKQQAIEAGAFALVNWAAGQESRYHSDRLGGHAKAVVIVGMWFGHLEAVNDTEWGEVVRAAQSAMEAACAEHGAGLGCEACHLYPDVFFSALLLEGLAKGEQGRNDCDYHVRLHPDEKCSCPPPVPSWFDEHARFTVHPHAEDCIIMKSRRTDDCSCGARAFIIPPLTFTYDDGAGQ